ncbi:Papilin [Eumeta japonica]|uniref:Papilin n=1 Tax=Eumeta variegata TaxID=151549 RepID=A0A4C1T8T0_EUMVA|nr:Papilin [Eumeta japonica]
MDTKNLVTPQDSIEKYAWSTWGSWSPCSKTCGGGVAVQERSCLPRDSTSWVAGGGATRDITHPPERSLSSAAAECKASERERSIQNTALRLQRPADSTAASYILDKLVLAPFAVPSATRATIFIRNTIPKVEGTLAPPVISVRVSRQAPADCRGVAALPRVQY